MKKQITLIILFISILGSSLQAQKLLKPFDRVSGKKTSYITKEGGKEIQGKVAKIKRKKGLIKQIEISTKKGKKTVVPIEDIDFAYLPQTGWDKFVKFDDFIGDSQQWDSGLYDQDRMKEGYAYFEKVEVMVKKKKLTLLMQLLNPGTCSRIKVYHDPYANETMAPSVLGVKVAGGNDKSYYISIDGDVAFKLAKKKYRSMFPKVFGDCKALKPYAKKSWAKFEEALFLYNKECKK